MHTWNRLASASGRGPVDNNNLGRTPTPPAPLTADGDESFEAADAVSERKRRTLPEFRSVLGDALEMERQEKHPRHDPSLEPFIRIIRRVVREEWELLERAPTRFHYGHHATLPRQVSIIRLSIGNKLARSVSLFTGQAVKGEDGFPISIILRSTNTGQRVTTGPESAAILEVVVLNGDFANQTDEWTAEEFEQNIVKERKGKCPLLAGNPYVTLNEGFGLLGELSITDNSSWTRSKTFSLGFRVVRIPGVLIHNLEGSIRIHECKTEAFTVKDQRGKHYEKHYPPALDDEVWRLEKIHKDGALHKRLQEHGIDTVDAFLRNLAMDPQNLRSILGRNAVNKAWDTIVAHAKTCKTAKNGKMYVYYYAREFEDEEEEQESESRNKMMTGVVFDCVYEPMGLVSMNGELTATNDLSEDDKMNLDALVKAACTNWQYVTEYKEEENSKKKKKKIIRDDGSSSCFESADALMMMNVVVPTTTISTTYPHADIHHNNYLPLQQPNLTFDDDDDILLRTFPTPNYDELLWECSGPTFGFPRSSSSVIGKPYVSWLKVKALLRWGIFKRKPAIIAADDDDAVAAMNTTGRALIIQATA